MEIKTFSKSQIAAMSDEDLELELGACDKAFNEALDAPTLDEYMALCRKIRSVQFLLQGERNIRKKPNEIILRDYNDLDEECKMDRQEFITAVKYGMFTSDDGYGYYATDDKVSNIVASPAQIYEGYIRTDFTHVVWYNK